MTTSELQHLHDLVMHYSVTLGERATPSLDRTLEACNTLLRSIRGRINGSLPKKAGLLLALSLCAGPAMAQHVAPPAQHHRMPAPLVAPEAWAYVQACSGVLWPDGLRRVVWTHGPLRTYVGTPDTIFGQWFPPDTIWVMAGYEQHIHVITHELLHHLLGVQKGSPHPVVPFARPCGLMIWQSGWFHLPMSSEALTAVADSLMFPPWGSGGTR